jgi:type II secretory pathway component PulF
MVFTRQAKMLLDAGAALVPALEAIEKQCTKSGMRAVVRQLCDHVEQGGALSDALAKRPDVFSPVFCCMIAAGEATATLGASFDRLSNMAIRAHQVRKAVVGALLYPAILTCMCTATVGVLIGFVVPRFKDLFTNLRATLPFSTKLMFGASDWLSAWWPMLLGALVAIAALLWFALRRADYRRRLDEFLLRMPMLGRVVSRLMAARVLRVWAAMLRSHVPLLETIRQSKTAVTSPVLLDALQSIETAVAGGGRVGRTLTQTKLVEPVVASAITTGEENGRLSEAVDFVATWLDDDNTQLVAAATRVVEPLLLAGMGGIVGLVAMSLFLPLFDMAMAGGG